MADLMLDLAGTGLMRKADPFQLEAKYREGLRMLEAAYTEDPQIAEKEQYLQELSTHYWG